jgi:hypothetical protein
MYNSALRENKNGSQEAWSKDELLAGLHHFYQLNGRFPTAHEIDAFKYLPSSRSIQRAYGGLVKLRSELLPTEIANFTKGAYRSLTAKRTFANGRAYEREFYGYLIGQFKEIAVHEHKLIRPGDVSCDFFIYMSDSSGVVVDIFYAESVLNLVNVVNIKLKRYQLINQETFLVVVGNDSITQDLIDLKSQNRQLPLPPHIHVVSETYFKSEVVPNLKPRSAFGI